MTATTNRILMGNEAIGRGLVESGCTLVASYPGTPSSEILESVVAFAHETGAHIHTEWSVNEKVAFEVALANSYTGNRSAVSMKQVGLNVASDPFIRSAYLGVKGGLVVIAADDPGPHSSQTEQDSRFFSFFAKVPVLDPSSPREAKLMVNKAFELSEKYEIPVMLRPTTRVCHSRQSVPCLNIKNLRRTVRFDRDPGRWCATPQFVKDLHLLLNEKIDRIASEKEIAPVLTAGRSSRTGTCIISSGVAFAHTFDLLEDMGILEKVDLYQVILPYPLNKDFIRKASTGYEQILVIEETYPVIETQMPRTNISGRGTGTVPSQGELTPDIIRNILEKFLGRPGKPAAVPEKTAGTRPTLCAGCSHRASYYAIRNTFPKGIITGDIGCYTLGMNLGAVDTVHCMGAGISQAAGFYHAFKRDGGDFPTIVATIGDSTFFHAGIPALINAVFHQCRMILVILDNSTTAMTGRQPTPQTGFTADGKTGNRVFISDLVQACGVKFRKDCDPYDQKTFVSALKEADNYCRSDKGGVAVIISRHPCILDKQALKGQPVYRMSVTEDCSGCRICLKKFECPALVPDEDTGRIVIDKIRCIGCGVCVFICPTGAIIAEGTEG